MSLHVDARAAFILIFVVFIFDWNSAGIIPSVLPKVINKMFLSVLGDNYISLFLLLGF